MKQLAIELYELKGYSISDIPPDAFKVTKDDGLNEIITKEAWEDISTLVQKLGFQSPESALVDILKTDTGLDVRYTEANETFHITGLNGEEVHLTIDDILQDDFSKSEDARKLGQWIVDNALSKDQKSTVPFPDDSGGAAVDNISADATRPDESGRTAGGVAKTINIFEGFSGAKVASPSSKKPATSRSLPKADRVSLISERIRVFQPLLTKNSAASESAKNAQATSVRTTEKSNYPYMELLDDTTLDKRIALDTLRRDFLFYESQIDDPESENKIERFYTRYDMGAKEIADFQQRNQEYKNRIACSVL